MKLKNTADTLDPICKWSEAQRGCINRPEDARQWVLIWLLSFFPSTLGFGSGLPTVTRPWAPRSPASSEFLEPLEAAQSVELAQETPSTIWYPKVLSPAHLAALLTVFSSDFWRLEPQRRCKLWVRQNPSDVIWVRGFSSLCGLISVPPRMGWGLCLRCRMPQSLHLRDPRPSC